LLICNIILLKLLKNQICFNYSYNSNILHKVITTKIRKTMTNKLKVTSALVGSLLALSATSAVAQTTVSGNLALSYIAAKSESRAQSFRGFGKESQLNISNKGKLNNGLDYVAGFSIEMDGADTATSVTAPTGNTLQGQQSENVYIDLISGNTTVSIGADHFQNADNHLTNIVGFGYLGASGIGGIESIYPANVNAYQSYGIGLAQNTSIGSFGIYYTPTNKNAQAGNDIFNGVTKAQLEGAANVESAYEVTYKGNLGITGLTGLASYTSSANAAPGNVNDATTSRIGAQYNMGSFTVAYDRTRVENTLANVAATNKIYADSVGVAYAVNKDVSVGLTYASATDKVTVGAKDEEIIMAAVGYNLGPVSVQAQYKNVQNNGGLAANDGQTVSVYLNTKF
jgi:hypothetical protein